MTSTLIPPLIGAFGLLVAVIIYGIVRRYDAGSAALVKLPTLFTKALWFS